MKRIKTLALAALVASAAGLFSSSADAFWWPFGGWGDPWGSPWGGGPWGGGPWGGGPWGGYPYYGYGAPYYGGPWGGPWGGYPYYGAPVATAPKAKSKTK